MNNTFWTYIIILLIGLAGGLILFGVATLLVFLAERLGRGVRALYRLIRRRRGEATWLAAEQEHRQDEDAEALAEAAGENPPDPAMVTMIVPVNTQPLATVPPATSPAAKQLADPAPDTDPQPSADDGRTTVSSRQTSSYPAAAATSEDTHPREPVTTEEQPTTTIKLTVDEVLAANIEVQAQRGAGITPDPLVVAMANAPTQVTAANVAVDDATVEPVADEAVEEPTAATNQPTPAQETTPAETPTKRGRRLPFPGRKNQEPEEAPRKPVEDPLAELKRQLYGG